MDILIVFCLIYAFLGSIVGSKVLAGDINYNNFLYFFKRPINRFTKINMIIFSPILLLLIIIVVFTMLGCTFLICTMGISLIVIKNILINIKYFK